MDQPEWSGQRDITQYRTSENSARRHWVYPACSCAKRMRSRCAQSSQLLDHPMVPMAPTSGIVCAGEGLPPSVSLSSYHPPP